MPRPPSASAPAPGVPAEVRSDLGLMPKFYDWGGSFSGSFTSTYASVTVDASKSSGTVSVDVRTHFSLCHVLTTSSVAITEQPSLDKQRRSKT